MAKVSGDKAHVQRLRRMRGPALVRGVTQALFGVANDIAIDAAISITTGATSGKGHVPSAPGTPPNADTHVLDRSIRGESTGPLKAETIADAPYAAAQELGSPSRNLPERPYLRPAAARNRRPAQIKVSAAVDKVIRASG